MEYLELVRDYLDDADVHLKAFDAAMLSLEKTGLDGDVVFSALGSLHTLKGNSGMMGFESLKIFIHQAEDILKKVHEKEIPLSRVISGLLGSANVIRSALQNIMKNPKSPPDLSEDLMVLQSYLDGSLQPEFEQETNLQSYLGAKTDTIKVDFKRLDGLLDLVGELVIYKTRLNQIEGRLRESAENKMLIKDLNAGLEMMGKTVSGLQEGIMKARMLPVRNVFHKFTRMVRDLSRRQNKEMRLFFKGEDTELDKTVIDELEEPLLHIIRNAVDHGIETPDERLQKGKERSGSITLGAAQESSFVIITVEDDGHGIDFESVRQKALQQGLISQEEHTDREKVFSLIFSAGFSTKKETDDISGRGIGLDVVSRNITKLNGQVSVNSSPGKGTVFTIKLPLSLAIIPALMAETGGEVFAIPMSSVDESIKVREEDIHVINNNEVVRFRNSILPVVRLDEFFGLNAKKTKRFYLVILGKSDRRMAVAVDRLRGQQEIVIKPLDETFGKFYGIAGASILGDGKIVLIVDVLSFWNKKQAVTEQKPAGNG